LVDTKISGLAALAFLYAWLAGGVPRRLWPAAAAAGAGAVATATAALVLVAGNPSLYHAPLSFLAEMYSYRWRVTRLQAVAFPLQIQPAFLEQACGFLKGLFFAADRVSLVTCAATAVLAGAGLADARLRAREPAAWGLCVIGAGWTAVSLLTFKIAWLRYLLPCLPFLCLVAALGPRRPRRLAGAALAAALLWWPAHRFTIERWYARHPDVLAAKYGAARAYIALHVPGEPAR
jgi:hypothetical protein